MRIAVALLLFALSVPAAAQSGTVPPDGYVLHLSLQNVQIVIRGLRKLPIEDAADLLNDIVKQAQVQEQEAAKKNDGAK